jgi:hypothetical protein
MDRQTLLAHSQHRESQPKPYTVILTEAEAQHDAIRGVDYVWGYPPRSAETAGRGEVQGYASKFVSMRRRRDRAFQQSWASLQKSVQILDEEKKMIRVGGAGFESPLKVPVAGGVIFGMNQKRPDSGNFGGLRGSQERILEQRPTDALKPAVNRKPRQHHRLLPASVLGRLGKKETSIYLGYTYWKFDYSRIIMAKQLVHQNRAKTVMIL